jgi:hypothetical protein
MSEDVLNFLGRWLGASLFWLLWIWLFDLAPLPTAFFAGALFAIIDEFKKPRHNLEE